MAREQPWPWETHIVDPLLMDAVLLLAENNGKWYAAHKAGDMDAWDVIGAAMREYQAAEMQRLQEELELSHKRIAEEYARRWAARQEG